MFNTLAGDWLFLGAAVVGSVFFASPVCAANLITLASFNGAIGRRPNGSLIAAADGNLYGTTQLGGTNNRGTVFKLDPATGAITTLASFNYPVNGCAPQEVLIADAEGNLYGTASRGLYPRADYGVVFKLTDTGFVVPAVPEPASLSLLALGCAAMSHRRRA